MVLTIIITIISITITMYCHHHQFHHHHCYHHHRYHHHCCCTDFHNYKFADFCHGRSCHSRALFIVICTYVLELYSKAFFKEYFFEYALSLTADPVPNIRMRMCRLLPSLKRLIKLPQDHQLKASLEQCVRKTLVNEKDRDVLQAMKQVG